MTNTYDTLFSLLKTSLWGAETYPLSASAETDWQAVYTELRHHTIQNLPVDCLAKADPSHAALYRQHALRGISHWYRLMQEQQYLCCLLRDQGIPCAVLKGAAAAHCYPHPENRSMGDIDLIVKPEDFDRASKLLLEICEYLGENRRHIELRRNGIVVELHRSFSTFNDAAKNQLLDGLIFKAINHAEWVQLEGFSFPMLPPEINGLVLLEHINVHMESGLGLRQIIDWMLFADRHLENPVWEQNFLSTVRQLGLQALAVSVTRMCQIYLGLRQDITWCHGADDTLCGDLMSHTLQQGNFGRKLPRGYNRTVNLLSTAKKGPALLRSLQRRGCINWPLLKKLPWLRPFAWLYQLCRYIRRGLQLNHPIRHLRSALKKEHQQDILFDRLGITRMKEEHET